MTLPDEPAAAQHIATKFQAELKAMTDLHDAVVTHMFGGNWAVTKPMGLDPMVTNTVAGLLTKACKTFRAAQLLCAAGLGTDAGTVVRSLLETTVAIFFILKTRSRERARLFHTHSAEQRLKILNHWKRTKGLKRQATKKMFASVTKDLAYIGQRLPAGANAKQHWSGKGSLEEALKTLKGDAVYAILYRHTSGFAHVADFREHVDYDQAANVLVFKLAPTTDHIAGQAIVSRVMLWGAAARINERLGLGFDAALNPHKPSKVK